MNVEEQNGSLAITDVVQFNQFESKKKKKKSFQFFSFSLVLSTQKIIASLLSREFFSEISSKHFSTRIPFLSLLLASSPYPLFSSCFLSLCYLLLLLILIFFSLSLSVWFNRLDVTWSRGILLPAAHGETKLGPLVDDRFAYCNIITQAHID